VHSHAVVRDTCVACVVTCGVVCGAEVRQATCGVYNLAAGKAH
jgi:hypothetical protein